MMESKVTSHGKPSSLRLVEINCHEYDYNVNQFYIDYQHFLQNLESGKVEISETLTLENGRKVIVYTNGVKNVELKNQANRTVSLDNFQYLTFLDLLESLHGREFQEWGHKIDSA